MLKTTFTVVATCLLTACASVSLGNLSTIEIGLAPVNQTSFEIADLRAPDSKVLQVQEYSGVKEIYLGDNSVSPKPFELLKAWLQAKAGGKLAGQKVELTGFELRIFDGNSSVDQERLGAASTSVPGGALAAPIAGLLISAIEREIKTSASYRITVNGEEIRGSANRGYRGELTEKDLAVTLQLALDDLASKL
jgi:hypothetical protein